MRKFLITAVLLPNLLASVAVAGESSFDGDVSVGVIAIDSANNLNPNSSKRILADLDSAADRELQTIPIILPNFTYSPDTDTSFYYSLSSRPPIEEAGAFALSLGVGFTMESVADVDLGIFAAPFGEVWENPYVVGAPRDDTDNSKYGAFAKFANVLSSRFGITLVYFLDDVDNDVIGNLQPELERDGQVFSTILGYTHSFSPSLSIAPKIQYTLGDYDGDASSYDSYAVKLGGRYSSGNWSILPEFSYSYTEYDEVHPVFDETRKEDKLSFNLIVQYSSPFGFDDYLVRGLAGYSEGDNDIDFFDTESIRAGITVVYQF